MPPSEDGPSTEGITPDTYTPSYDRPKQVKASITERHVDVDINKSEFDWSLVRSGKTSEENWFVTSWRPLAAYVYLFICLFDFVLAPIMTMLISGLIVPWFKGTGTYIPWHPITLEGAGLFHMAMGAIIGIYTWGRTKEKIDPNSDDSKG